LRLSPKTFSLATCAAILTTLCTLAISTVQEAESKRRFPGPSLKPRKYGLLRLNRKKQFPARVIPRVRRARIADGLGGRANRRYRDRCGNSTVDLGTLCIQSNPFPLVNSERGLSNYAFATRRCAEEGGYLPSAAELIGAAERIRLNSVVGDSELEASVDQDPSDGLRDRREMSADLTTTAAGSRAAGSQGVSEGSRGNPRTGEPNPTPQPANPFPETLQYITVYDNGNRGGFAGSKPVNQAEAFRCAFNKSQGNFGAVLE